MTINLRHVTPLGLLQNGVYPTKTHEPIIYMYYRPDGNLYLYRTKEEIEINLTDISAYDNTTLFYVGTERSLQSLPVTAFEARTIIENKSTYTFKGVKESNQYVYILVPAIYKVFAIFIDAIESRILFSLDQIYMHKGQGYYVYRSNDVVALGIETDIQIVYDNVTAADLTEFLGHINDKNNPHDVTKEQVGLGEVDNTSDLDKPISNATQNALDELSNIFNSQIIDQIEFINGKLQWKEGSNLATTFGLKVIRGTTEQIESTPIVDKQFLFDEELQRFYIDSNDERLSYGGGGIEVLINPNANLILEEGIYYCKGDKTGFPILPGNVELNASLREFILHVQKTNTTYDSFDQIISFNGTTALRYIDRQGIIGNWQWSRVGQNTLLNTTATFDIVAAINEVNTKASKSIISNQINEIRIINEGDATTDNGVLYVEIFGYQDGIDYMEVQDMFPTPPFEVR